MLHLTISFCYCQTKVLLGLPQGLASSIMVRLLTCSWVLPGIREQLVNCAVKLNWLLGIMLSQWFRNCLHSADTGGNSNSRGAMRIVFLVMEKWTSLSPLQRYSRGYGSLPILQVLFGLGEGLWRCPLGNMRHWILFTSGVQVERAFDRENSAVLAVMQTLHCTVMVKIELSIKAELFIYQSVFDPTITYGLEPWVNEFLSQGGWSYH